MKVLKSERQGIAVYLSVEQDDGTVATHIIVDGSLESRAALYGLADEEEALDALLVEWHVLPSDEFLPEKDQAGAKDLIRKNKAKVQWDKGVDKKLLVDNMKLPKAKGDRVRAAALEVVDTPPASLIIDDSDVYEAQTAYAAGHQRMLEERKADDIISALPDNVRNQPRKAESPLSTDMRVGLAVQFVP